MAASLQQQHRPQAILPQTGVQRSTADEACWRPQEAAQHVQQHQLQELNSNSLQKDESGEDVGVGMGGIERGFRPNGGAGVAAAMVSDTAAVNARASPQPQVLHPPCPLTSCTYLAFPCSHNPAGPWSPVTTPGRQQLETGACRSLAWFLAGSAPSKHTSCIYGVQQKSDAYRLHGLIKNIPLRLPAPTAPQQAVAMQNAAVQ